MSMKNHYYKLKNKYAWERIYSPNSVRLVELWLASENGMKKKNIETELSGTEWISQWVLKPETSYLVKF